MLSYISTFFALHRAATKIVVNGEVIDDDLFFDAKAE